MGSFFVGKLGSPGLCELGGFLGLLVALPAPLHSQAEGQNQHGGGEYAYHCTSHRSLNVPTRVSVPVLVRRKK